MALADRDAVHKPQTATSDRTGSRRSKSGQDVDPRQSTRTRTPQTWSAPTLKKLESIQVELQYFQHFKSLNRIMTSLLPIIRPRRSQFSQLGSSSKNLRYTACSSRLVDAQLPIRSFSSSRCQRDILQDLDKQLNPREIIEKKRKIFEEKYGDKLKRKIEA